VRLQLAFDQWRSMDSWVSWEILTGAVGQKLSRSPERWKKHPTFRLAINESTALWSGHMGAVYQRLMNEAPGELPYFNKRHVSPSQLDQMKISRSGIIASSAPSLLLLFLFYSLAFHMHQRLGVWPGSIGTNGFPRLLAVHAEVTGDLFNLVLLSSLFLAPGAIAACAATPRWRRNARYFLLYVVMFFVCWGLMQLAPGQFLNWWRD